MIAWNEKKDIQKTDFHADWSCAHCVKCVAAVCLYGSATKNELAARCKQQTNL
jgi:hypothetical protein